MEKRGLLIYPSTTPRGNNAFGWFREAAARHGMSVEVLFYDAPAAEAPAGAPAWKPDFVLMRGYNIALSRWYGGQGVPVLNAPEAMILCRDKLRCGEVLAAAGVPVPGALSPEEAGSGDAFPFILKLNFGSKGENVFLVRDASEYRSALEACRREEVLRLEALSRGISEFGETPEEVRRGCVPVLQEFVATSSGRDIRVWVTGDEVAGHVLRYNPSTISPPGAPSVRFRCLPPLPLSPWPLPVPAGSSLRGWTCCSTMMPVPLPIALPSLILRTFHAERHIPAASRSARSTAMPASVPPRPTFPMRCSAISPASCDQPVRSEMAGSIPCSAILPTHSGNGNGKQCSRAFLQTLSDQRVTVRV